MDRKEVTTTPIGITIAVASLRELMNLQFVGTTSYWLARNFDVLERLDKTFAKTREDIIKKYGTADAQGMVGVQPFIVAKDEEGNDIMDDIQNPDGTTSKHPRMIKNPNHDICINEINAVGEESVTIGIFPLKFDSFVNAKKEQIDIKPSMLRNILFLFEE